MTSRFRQVQPIMAYAKANLRRELSLTTLAVRAGLSPFQLHRMFLHGTGQTTKQFTLRLRLDRAATLLLARRVSVLKVALSCGFRSHEAFCRAFRKRFGMSPRVYRKRGFTVATSASEAASHAMLMAGVGPCIGLFHRQGNEGSMGVGTTYSITRTIIQPQPVLLIRKRVKRSEIAAALGELFGRIVVHAQTTGAALSGQPFTRYVEWGPGLLTLEAGLPVAAAVPGQADILAGTLPGGPAATTTHVGPYERLSEGHAAVQVWIEDQGLEAASPPWEVYVTDPADYPDPKDWRTDIVWPLLR